MYIKYFFLKNTLLSIVLFLSFASCSVSWVPAYNEALETQIINGQKMTTKFYNEMISDDSAHRTYINYQKGYTEISTEISSIRFQINAMKNNSDVLANVDSLKSKWGQYEIRHKNRDANHKPTLDNIIIVNNNIIDGYWKTLLIDLRALKMVRK